MQLRIAISFAQQITGIKPLKLIQATMLRGRMKRSLPLYSRGDTSHLSHQTPRRAILCFDNVQYSSVLFVGQR